MDSLPPPLAPAAIAARCRARRVLRCSLSIAAQAVGEINDPETSSKDTTEGEENEDTERDMVSEERREDRRLAGGFREERW